MKAKFVPTYEAVLFDGSNIQEVSDFVAQYWSDPNEVTVVSRDGGVFLVWGYYNYEQEIAEGTWITTGLELFPDGSRTRLDDVSN